MTYDRIKDLPEGALLWYGTDIGFYGFGTGRIILGGFVV